MKTRNFRPLSASLALLLAAGCGRSEGAETTRVTPTMVLAPQDMAVAEVGPVGTGMLLTGTLRPDNSASVKAQAPGTISGLRVKEGERVRAGQVLAVVQAAGIQSQAAGAQAGVASAEAGLALARRQMESARTLYQAGAMSELDYRATQAGYEAARGQLAAARAGATGANEAAGRATVRAPMSGVVSERLVEEGEAVAPGQPLVTIVDPTKLQLQASVPATSVGQLRVGAPVEFRVQGYPGRVFRGVVERINPVADAATRQVEIYVTVPNNGGALVAGLFAEGQVQSEARNALAVPAKAVDQTGQTASVLRVRAGKTERVSVQTGLRDPNAERVEVVAGLAPGDTVLVGAAMGTTPGTPVRVGGS